MQDCLFCKLVAGELPSAKIWEDETFIAILDAFPNTLGMTLLLTKQHYPSDPSQLPSVVYEKGFNVARTLSEHLKRGLGVERVALVCEGMGVNHFHIKLYPLHGVDASWKPIHSPMKVWFDRYPGFLSTQMGWMRPMNDLQELAAQVRSSIGSS